MIVLRNLEKVYETGRQKTWVLRRINLDVNEGEFVSIMGPSGAGKSTLPHVLGMHDFGWTGEYFLDGHPAHKLRKKAIGATNTDHRLRVSKLSSPRQPDRLREHRSTAVVPQRTRRAEKIDRLRHARPLSNSRQKRPLPQSAFRGQQQRVAIARALVANLKLILDEPTGSLQQRQAKKIMDLFLKLNQEDGITIVQVTHSESNAAYGRRIIQIVDGWIEGPKVAETGD